MKQLSIRNSMLAGSAAAVVALGAVVAACSSSSGGGGDNGSSSSGSSGGTSSGTTSSSGAGTGSCSNPTVGIAFSPMYSAFIPGSTAQTFQIPAVTDDGNSANWTASDNSSVTLTSDPTTGGVMITVTGTGTNGAVVINATESGGACGAATLNITTNTENDWQTGSARYNDGVALHVGAPPGYDGGIGGGGGGEFEGGVPEGGFGHHDGGGFHKPDGGGFFQQDGGSFFEEEGGTACTNCHGANSTSGLFIDVSHTPEQTGGFSDQDLIDIIVNGNVPDGGYFDPNVIIPDASADPTGATQARAYETWHKFHQWSDITQDEYAGIVCYLRSLTPAPQNGTSGINFGGHGKGGGGGTTSSGGGTTSSGGGTTSSSGGTASGSSSGTASEDGG